MVQTCSSMAVSLCTKWGPQRHGLPRLVRKILSFSPSPALNLFKHIWDELGWSLAVCKVSLAKMSANLSNAHALEWTLIPKAMFQNILKPVIAAKGGLNIEWIFNICVIDQVYTHSLYWNWPTSFHCVCV